MRNKEVPCPACGSNNAVRKGSRKTKFGQRQLYRCNGCMRTFTGGTMPNKTYGPKVIVSALTLYNSGSTLDATVKAVNRRFKAGVTKTSVHRWAREFGDVCTYGRLRRDVMKNYIGGEIIAGRTFEHSGLAYNFRYHRPKLDILCTGFPSVAEYVGGFERGCPEYFNAIENRCSDTRIGVKIDKQGKYNNACRLAGLALSACDRSRERHSSVENFMLVNDSSTIACEVPVWLWEKNLGTGVSGHIDILQVRNGLVHILDFKPEAAFENEQKVASQLFLYASGLSFRTKTPLDKLRCAWFDDKVYFEFDPSKADIRFPGSKWRSDAGATDSGNP